MVFVINNKRPIGKYEDIHPGEMMFLYKIKNNILISGMLFLGGYQVEYENWDLYQEISIF